MVATKRTSGPKPRAAGRGTAPARRAAARRFLERYKKAWETRDAALAASLFTRDAHYWETPFNEVAVGREAVRSYWQRATEKQEHIRFSVGHHYLTRYHLVAEWICHYTDKGSGERRELAGVLLADFYGGQVRTFREYWHRRVLPSRTGQPV